MKLYFYRGDEPNFGDELNTWLMPRVFPGLFDDGTDGVMMLAIGSVLFDWQPKDVLKLVYGSGYGGYTALPRFDETWRFYCVRGPRTAQACGLGPESVAGDTAILMHEHWPRGAAKRWRASFMPHFHSLDRGRWEEASRLAGLNFIDPRGPVEQVLQAIVESEVVVTEAMHGAIVADALRVPWIATLPFDPGHKAKWADWSEALDMDVRFQSLRPSTWRELVLSRRGAEGPPVPRRSLRRMVRAAEGAWAPMAAASLATAARREPQLSSDAAIDRALDRLHASAERLRADYPAYTA